MQSKRADRYTFRRTNLNEQMYRFISSMTVATDVAKGILHIHSTC